MWFGDQYNIIPTSTPKLKNSLIKRCKVTTVKFLPLFTIVAAHIFFPFLKPLNHKGVKYNKDKLMIQ